MTGLNPMTTDGRGKNKEIQLLIDSEDERLVFEIEVILEALNEVWI